MLERLRTSQWVIFLGLLLFAALVRAQTFNNPVLGFDEQFYLLVGDRMLHGAVPFVDIFDRKPIGLFLIYAGIRELGGDGFVQYKLVACLFVAATAFLIYRAARPISSTFAALAAACLYILWLNFTEGEGGQSEVFLNLPMVAAALLTWRAVETRAEMGHRRIMTLGCAAMLLVGIAMQIKYTALFQGIFFGCALLWVHYQARRSVIDLFIPTLAYIACALLPTALAILYYWHIGQLSAFIFANFNSIFGRPHDPFLVELLGFVTLCGIISPLIILGVVGERPLNPKLKFVYFWLFVTVLNFTVFGGIFGIAGLMYPLPPLVLSATPFFNADNRRRLIGLGVIALAFVAGQIVINRVAFGKGGYDAAMQVAAAAQPHPGHCIYVFDGYPALYMLTHSCLPTRWVFPGHINTSDEASAKSLGVDPAVELRRILETRPEVIVDDAPIYAFANPTTRAIINAALAKDYRLVARIKTGTARFRLVYRLK